MFLKPVWVGKIHGVGVYATHSVRIWWLRVKEQIFFILTQKDVRGCQKSCPW